MRDSAAAASSRHDAPLTRWSAPYPDRGGLIRMKATFPSALASPSLILNFGSRFDEWGSGVWSTLLHTVPNRRRALLLRRRLAHSSGSVHTFTFCKGNPRCSA
ncbi:hypothetical protein TRVL_05701 [Trypanosoma vivax]|nr:hypothetical protein TRVL_05701 [Trypanosoma vivax]